MRFTFLEKNGALHALSRHGGTAEDIAEDDNVDEGMYAAITEWVKIGEECQQRNRMKTSTSYMALHGVRGDWCRHYPYSIMAREIIRI